MGPGGSDTAMGWQYHGGCTGQGEPHSPSDLPRQHPTGEKPFLTFEVVSLVPYDRNLIDVSLLSQEHVREPGRAEVGARGWAGDGHSDGDVSACRSSTSTPTMRPSVHVWGRSCSGSSWRRSTAGCSAALSPSHRAALPPPPLPCWACWPSPPSPPCCWLSCRPDPAVNGQGRFFSLLLTSSLHLLF